MPQCYEKGNMRNFHVLDWETVSKFRLPVTSEVYGAKIRTASGEKLAVYPNKYYIVSSQNGGQLYSKEEFDKIYTPVYNESKILYVELPPVPSTGVTRLYLKSGGSGYRWTVSRKDATAFSGDELAQLMDTGMKTEKE